MNTSDPEIRLHVLELLLEGCSYREVQAHTTLTKDTIARLVQKARDVCRAYTREHMAGLAPQRLEAGPVLGTHIWAVWDPQTTLVLAAHNQLSSTATSTGLVSEAGTYLRPGYAPPLDENVPLHIPAFAVGLTPLGGRPHAGGQDPRITFTMFYHNFIRHIQTGTPAMQAGVTDQPLPLSWVRDQIAAQETVAPKKKPWPSPRRHG